VPLSWAGPCDLILSLAVKKAVWILVNLDIVSGFPRKTSRKAFEKLLSERRYPLSRSPGAVKLTDLLLSSTTTVQPTGSVSVAAAFISSTNALTALSVLGLYLGVYENGRGELSDSIKKRRTIQSAHEI
jgi:hypothetical protein